MERKQSNIREDCVKSETKLFFEIIGGAIVVAALACEIDRQLTKDRLPLCNPILAHLEVHCDRPIEDVIKEIEREHETEYDRFERECEESDRETEFGQMV